MERPLATGAGLVFIGRIHAPWTLAHWKHLSYLVDRSWISLPPMIGLAAQVIFAMFPVIQVWRR